MSFVGGPDDPATAAYVQLRDLRPSGTGTKYLPLDERAEISRNGHQLSTLEPENAELKEALDVLDRGVLSGVDTSRTPW